MTRVKYNDNDLQIFSLVSKNISYYRAHNNCKKELLDSSGRITLEKLSELCEVSTSLLLNISSPKTKQSFSLALIGRVAKALNVELYCFFLPEPIPSPPPYKKINL